MLSQRLCFYQHNDINLIINIDDFVCDTEHSICANCSLTVWFDLLTITALNNWSVIKLCRDVNVWMIAAVEAGFIQNLCSNMKHTSGFINRTWGRVHIIAPPLTKRCWMCWTCPCSDYVSFKMCSAITKHLFICERYRWWEVKLSLTVRIRVNELLLSEE